MMEMIKIMYKNEIKVNDKLTVFYDECDSYEAFVYRMTINYRGEDISPFGSAKYYLGYHKGDIHSMIIQEYMSSSVDVNEIIKRDDIEIFLEILKYGTVADMSNFETNLLREVNAKNNPEYFNKNNGGGKHVVSKKTVDSYIDPIKKIKDNINNGRYPKNQWDKKILANLPKNQVMQIRDSRIDPEHVKNIQINLAASSSGNYDPIHVLMPEDGDKSKCKLINGNHTVAAANKVKTLQYLNVYEIPYADWKNLSDSQLSSLGMLLNPREPVVRKSTSLDDLARLVIQMIREKNLFKNDKPIFNHDLIKHTLEIVHGITNPITRGEITKKSKALYDKEVYGIGQNFISHSESFYKLDAELARHYKNNLEKHWIALGFNVYKISLGDDGWKQVKKTMYAYDANGKVIDFPKKIHVYFYYPNIQSVTDINCKRVLETFIFEYENAYKHMGIYMTCQILPYSTTDFPGIYNK